MPVPTFRPAVSPSPRPISALGPLASLLLPLAAGALHFLGDQACPTRAETEEQLRRVDSDALRPDASSTQAGHFALLELGSAGLELRLFDESGQLVERRFLVGQKSCAEWSRIAAALLATWETELAAPDLTFNDQAPIASPAEAPAVSAVVPAARARPPQLEVGLGAGAASAGGNAFAASGTIFVGLGPNQRPFGVRLALEATTFRSQAVGVGDARWQRTALSLGGYGTFRAGGAGGVGQWKLELGGALLGGILTASGAGFEVPQSGAALEPGLEIWPRLRWDLAREWSVWAQAGAAIWFKSETLRVLSASQTTASAQIPTLDATATVGVSFLVDL